MLLLFSITTNAYALPECPMDFSKIWDKCFGMNTYAGGAKYVGGYSNGKRNGQGTYTFADGENYVGEFKDDSRHGQGTYTYNDGAKYVGEWKEGKRHGQGTSTENLLPEITNEKFKIKYAI